MAEVSQFLGCSHVQKAPLQDSPAKAGGEGLLVNDQQQKVVRFKNDMATAHAEWVTLATYSWKPTKPPVPMTQRRMLRHNA